MKKRFDLMKEVFSLIKKAGEFSTEMATTWQEERKVLRSSYYGSIQALQRRGLVEQQKKSNRIYYKLTDKGRKYKFPKKQTPIRRSDGYSTVIIFDIPEGMRRQRTIFRRYLIRNGYTLLQKSVLISPNKLSTDIIELVKELEIRPFLTVLSSKINYF